MLPEVTVVLAGECGSDGDLGDGGFREGSWQG